MKILRIFVFVFALVLSYSINAYSEDLSKEELKTMIATMINLKGDLCAKVISVTPLKIKDTYEVTCIEYRGGSGTVDYIFKINGNNYEAYRR